jgi:type I restriction enzyme, S subunit
MFSQKVGPDTLNGALNADFYAPVYLSIENRIRNSGMKFCRLGDMLQRVFKGAFYLLSSEYQESGVPFIRVTQINSSNVDLKDAVYISNATHSLQSKTAVKPGYLLFAKGGAYRHVAVVPSSILDANISQDLIGAVTYECLDSHFAFTFLQSKFGKPQLIRWQQGDAQPHLTNESVRQILTPFPDQNTQVYIGDKVRLAERVRVVAEAATKMIQSFVQSTEMSSALGVADRIFSRVSSDDLLATRLDPKFYGRRSLEVLQCCHAIGSTSISKLTPKVSNGFEERNFVEIGTPYVTVSEVSSGRLNLAKAPRIAPEIHVPQKARLSNCCVLVVRSGSIGTAVKVHSLDSEAVISSHLIRLEFEDERTASVVAAFLNSEVGKVLMWKIAYGAVQSQIGQDELLQIPVPDHCFENGHHIQQKMELFELAMRCEDSLLRSAVILVEALVMQEITQEELATAHSQLESGDQAGDRAILARLYEGGIDATDTRPLFPDLDAYYETLQMAEQALTDGGDE